MEFNPPSPRVLEPACCEPTHPRDAASAAAAAALERAAFDFRDLSEARALIFGAAAAPAEEEDDDLLVGPRPTTPSTVSHGTLQAVVSPALACSRCGEGGAARPRLSPSLCLAAAFACLPVSPPLQHLRLLQTSSNVFSIPDFSRASPATSSATRADRREGNLDRCVCVCVCGGGRVG